MAFAKKRRTTEHKAEVTATARAKPTYNNNDYDR